MCFILTVVSCIITAIIWYLVANQRKDFFGKLSLMYAGASIMWTVDGLFRLFHGEAFLAVTMDDTLLGATVVVCGFFGLLLYQAWQHGIRHTLLIK